MKTFKVCSCNNKGAESLDTAKTPVEPVVISSGRKVSLADHLDLKNMPLATTPGGRNFTMKALHPSDHEIKSARVPGGNALSVALCSDQVSTIDLTSADSIASFTLMPHPLMPVSVQIIDGGVTTYYQFLNAAFGGNVQKNGTKATVGPAIDSFFKNVERYRITSESVTVELIAPSLADQGTITAAQWHNPPRTGNTSRIDLVNDTDLASAVYMRVQPDVWEYEIPADSSQLVLGTSAYTSKAKEGCYMPLKLQEFDFKDVNDTGYYINRSTEISQEPYRRVQTAEHLANWPFYVPTPADMKYLDMSPWPRMCGTNFGQIIVEGCAANVSLRVRVRQVVEVTVRPSSTYSPLVTMPLPPDEMAVKMYYEISARMADAYPASYNDLGKLRNIITRIGKAVAPYVDPTLSFLSGLPGPVGAIAGAAKSAVPIVRGLRKQLKKR